MCPDGRKLHQVCEVRLLCPFHEARLSLNETRVDGRQEQASLGPSEGRIERVRLVEVGHDDFAPGPLEICRSRRILDHGANGRAGCQQRLTTRRPLVPVTPVTKIIVASFDRLYPG